MISGRTCLRVIAAALMLVGFLIVLLSSHFYTVAHIREITDLAWCIFMLTFIPWPLVSRTKRPVEQ